MKTTNEEIEEKMKLCEQHIEELKEYVSHMTRISYQQGTKKVFSYKRTVDHLSRVIQNKNKEIRFLKMKNELYVNSLKSLYKELTELRKKNQE